MLITAHIAEGNPADHARGDPLEIERPSATAVNLHVITPGADKEHRTVRDKDFVFIHSRSNEDLISLTGPLQCRARPDVGVGIAGVDNQRPAPLRIGRWLAERLPSATDRA